ncbi:hypothetical protein [Thermoplasma volcanium GSS1]|uniref:ATP-NAD kinase n=1 Tax=Thermoplasma volcanium (strain ATCC 51530 / DSM 4299 / JCM 9571 / NBRC 15438 / GSS1) TaxID=273116 RepID=Q97BD3_THEVO|nr:ATP-NAD kinase family protein [Thermoplasma volcanium]BAB59665.1 hypothetical protein [Thermoplasma volcanium GSS1]
MNIAFVINPVAGLGATLNLKGSDGLALEDVSKSISIVRSHRFLKKLDFNGLHFFVPSGCMGESEVSIYTKEYDVIYTPSSPTTRQDTINFVKSIESADLLVFVGGDGTARDILNSRNDLPVIGVPAGVKMYSSVFAISPERAADAVNQVAKGNYRIDKAEVVDIDEELYRKGILSVKRYGQLKVPEAQYIVENSKAEYDIAGAEDIAEYVIEHMADETYIIGPGNTCKTIEEEMGIKSNVLGFDILRNKKLIKEDASESEIYEACSDKCMLVISPVGGQNFLLGRGNKQISDRILERVGEENLIVVSSPSKAEHLKYVYIDTQIPLWSNGYVKVLVGYGRYKLVKVIR